MERQVGKYIINTIAEEVTIENFYRYDVTVKIRDSRPIRLFGHELFFDQAAKLRYSDSESEITETLKEIIRDRETAIWKLKRMIAKN